MSNKEDNKKINATWEYEFNWETTLNPLHKEFKIINNESAWTLMVNYIIKEYEEKLINYINNKIKEIEKIDPLKNNNMLQGEIWGLVDIRIKIKNGDFR